MTKLQKLKEDLRQAKQYAKISKPLDGYLGNQYQFWKLKCDKIEQEILYIKKATTI